jgi:DNA-binding transcriptional LysR family regulator
MPRCGGSRGKAMIDWNDLRYFLAVARDGSTSGAARALGVNQSTVSRRIAALEEELGLSLFEKSRYGYRLIERGNELKECALATEAAVAAFCRAAAFHDEALQGVLRVTTAEGIAYGLLSPLLDEFHQLYPRMRVDLMLEDRFADLHQGQADVAVRAGRPSDSSLICRKLTDAAWAVYASRSYVTRNGLPETPAALNGHRLIAFDGAMARIEAARWLHNVAPQAEIVSRSNTILGHLMTIKSGFGIGVLPVHIGDPEPDLTRVVDPLPELMNEFWLLTHPDLKETPKVRAFFDYLAENIRKYEDLLQGRTRITGQ